MNEIANQLAQSLFKKNSLQECSRWELEILADKYPYFGVAQFLLANKLRDEDAEAYKKQAQKTSLYFTNPLWLDYTLNNQSGPSAETTIPENKAAASGHKTTEIAEEHLKFVPKADENIDEEASNDIIVKEPDPIIKTEPITTTHTEIISPSVIETVNEELQTSGVEVETDLADTQIATDLPAEIEMPPVYPEEQQEIQQEDTPQEEPFAPEMKIAPLKVEPMPDPDAPLVFEAFHTVDYFASQGIKLKLDDMPKDKFGQQLKSFTEWLKTLKKTTPTEISKQADNITDQKVITLAEHSIENRDVLTETMAEVWAKQGKKEKAIEVYEKLSLQNPAKSSYFATLIEQLKQQ